MQKTRVWKDSVLRLVYPVRCPVCDEIVADTGQLICPECEPKLKLLLPPWCMKCGKKVEDGEELCRDCRERQHFFVRGRALYEYGSAAASLYRFKYGNRQEYASFFGSQAADYLGDYIRRICPDALIPMLPERISEATIRPDCLRGKSDRGWTSRFCRIIWSE